MNRFKITLAVVCLLGCYSTASFADVFVPTGLNPGDTYHLAFITEGTVTGSSTDILTYNTFAQDQAALNPVLTGTDMGITWFAIASTTTTAAINNAIASAPIYLFDSRKLADGQADLYDTTIDTTFNINQFGDVTNDDEVWTGTSGSGQIMIGLGSNIPTTGTNFQTNFGWLDNSNTGSVTSHRMYVLSEQLTVPPAIPEPGSSAICLIVMAGILSRRRRA